ncbi:MAG: hypothetical protein BRD49_05800 [Bacteroidetes bacterium SW_10_40_5]|nr:MAG: hypothetical protein BRD49_05800 [Bacteroidetes bacterium SW_10_40_5]
MGQGALNAQGTKDKPIILIAKVPTKGYWRGISVNSPSTENKLNDVMFKYGGSAKHWCDGQSVVWVSDKNNGNLTMKNCEVHHCPDWGLTVNQSSGATITPSKEADLESQNNFHDHGMASGPNCSDCDINLK